MCVLEKIIPSRRFQKHVFTFMKKFDSIQMKALMEEEASCLTLLTLDFF